MLHVRCPFRGLWNHPVKVGDLILRPGADGLVEAPEELEATLRILGWHIVGPVEAPEAPKKAEPVAPQTGKPVRRGGKEK